MNRTTIMKELAYMGYDCEARDVEKNGVMLEGIVMGGGPGISPCYYLRDFAGFSDEEITQKIAERYDADKKEMPSGFENIFDADFVSRNIRIGLQKGDMGSYLSRHCLFLDGVSEFLYINVSDVFHAASIVRLTNDTAKRTGLSTDKLWKIAEENTKSAAKCFSMAELFGFSAEENPMWVITNEETCLGAASILNKELVRGVAKKLHTSRLVLLPSSIHEIILMPMPEDMSLSDMTDVVQEVNNNEVSDLEQLSDKATILDMEDGLWQY